MCGVYCDQQYRCVNHMANHLFRGIGFSAGGVGGGIYCFNFKEYLQYCIPVPVIINNLIIYQCV
jgi:hypothetical protein